MTTTKLFSEPKRKPLRMCGRSGWSRSVRSGEQGPPRRMLNVYADSWVAPVDGGTTITTGIQTDGAGDRAGAGALRD